MYLCIRVHTNLYPWQPETCTDGVCPGARYMLTDMLAFHALHAFLCVERCSTDTGGGWASSAASALGGGGVEQGVQRHR